MVIEVFLMRGVGVLSALLMTMMCFHAAAQTNEPAAPGEALLREGKWAEAREAFEAILRTDAENAAAVRGEVAASERLALDARGQGHMDDALSALLRAQRFAANDPRLLYDLGILEEEMGLYSDADHTLARLDAMKLPDPQVLYAVARVKMDLGQLAAAKAKMLAYLAVRPEDASAHYGLGRVYQLGADFAHARVEFQRSIELQPRQTEAYYQLGDMALSQEAYSEAIVDFAKTLARNPKHGGALTGTGEAYFKQKEYTQAVPFLERAVTAAPDYHPGHYYLGLTYARLGRKQDAERELARATELAAAQAQKDRGVGLQPEAPKP